MYSASHLYILHLAPAKFYQGNLWSYFGLLHMQTLMFYSSFCEKMSLKKSLLQKCVLLT